MSAISAKALNSTLGTENFKGFDEIFIQKMNELIEAAKPKKIQTVSLSLSEGVSKEASFGLGYAVDVNKSKIEITSLLMNNPGYDGNSDISGMYIAPSFESSTRVKIDYALFSDAVVTFTVTSY